MEAEQLFTMGVDALASSEWRVGHEFLRHCQCPVSLRELIDQPELALRVAWSNTRAGYATGREFQRLIAGRSEGTWLDDAHWPEHLADRLFADGLLAIRAAFQARHWETVVSLGELLVQLPAATGEREIEIFAVFVEIFTFIGGDETAVIAEIEVLRSFSELPRGDKPELLKRTRGTHSPFDVPVRVLGIAAQCDSYPTLAQRLLWSMLFDAQWPTLAFADEAFQIALWGELTVLYDDHQRRQQLGKAVQTWLERAIRDDEPQQYAPGEFADEEEEKS